MKEGGRASSPIENMDTNRFQTFFEEHAYVWAKRYIYNHHIRRKAVSDCIEKNQDHQLVLEIGCGLSPVVSDSIGVVYTDLSYTAVRLLKEESRGSLLVVADGRNLPFKPNVFCHCVASEVLEHIEDDEAVLKELSRVMFPGGQLTITFPHRKFYFAVDDRYVEHFRRYEIEEIKTKLLNSGLQAVEIRKILGPLEKITMWAVTGVLSLLEQFTTRSWINKKHHRPTNPVLLDILEFIYKRVNWCYGWLARLDANIMPLSLATVILLRARLSEPNIDGP